MRNIFLILSVSFLFCFSAFSQVGSQSSGTGQTYFKPASGAGSCNPASYVTLTGDVNNYAPTGLGTAARIMISDDDSGYEITGMAAQVDGYCVYIIPVGTKNHKIKANSASSIAANRFAIDGDMDLKVGQGYRFIYDATLQRWYSGGGYH